ncbi:LTA synthase family protein [Gardnerella pickettii]|uniref:LTA synthase family protein n=1 Tax=Gardnerella pickettii TaxID=2914924 RepID=UPI00041C5991|nr:LTA synthase family protein [Gardnerella pickettii]
MPLSNSLTIFKQFERFKIRFARWTYSVMFVAFCAIMVMIVQFSVQRSGRVEMTSSLSASAWNIISKMWLKLNFVFVLNLLILALIYGILLIIINRFWITSAILISASIIVSVIEYMKVNVRYETILPADLNFLKSNTGNIASFLPDNANAVIFSSIVAVLITWVIALLLHVLDVNHGKIVIISNLRTSILVRVVTLIALLATFGWYICTVGTVDSSANNFAKFMGDTPSMWDSVYDAQRNGALVAFLRQVNPKVMDKPADYNERTMSALLEKYNNEAKKINASRKSKISDNTVVYVLSESFSNPIRVPGLQLNKNPMPFISSVKEKTDSGLMLSSGYGGGTANLEYMSLTGLSMVNFNSSLTSPYQQLVPNSSWTPTINRYWGSESNSIAFHPYEPSMYLRSTNYKKFGFSKFYSLEAPNVIAHKNMLDKSPYVCDESAYKSAFEKIASGKNNQFVQIVTMQNHMPFRNWYKNNDFKASSKPGSPKLGSSEISSIETYAKGVNYTDKATQAFLNDLDSINKPVTVVFYGDHLPGIYSTASDDENNSLDLHLTDYFIWSNKKARENKQKEDNSSDNNARNNNANKNKVKDSYSSPNFFISQVASHTNSKVSPYLAFLTRLHEKISAMEPPVVNKIQGWDRIPQGQSIYLNPNGKPMIASSMNKETKQLLHDYRLIQYDITAGKHYLKNTNFLGF